MDREQKENSKIYKFLEHLFKIHTRDSRREFHLLLLAISFFFVALGVEFRSPPMTSASLVFFILGGVFLGLFFWFRRWSSKPDLGDPQEDLLKEMSKSLKEISNTLKRMDTKLDNKEKPDD